MQAGLVFLTFTLVRTKLPHYTLPAFPFIAIWLARAIPGLKIFRWAAAMTVFIVVLTTAGFVTARTEFASHQLFEKASPFLEPEMKFATVGYDEPSLVWEFRGIVTNDMQMLDANEAAGFIRENTPFVLIVPTDLYKTNLASLATNTVTVQVHGFNTVKGVRVDLTAIINR